MWKFEALWKLAKMAYSLVLRPLLVAAVEDPDKEWDDVILGIVDRLFEYEVAK